MSDPKYHDKHAADIYRAIALRFYCRYVDMRHSAENCGADLTGSHGRLPTGLEATEQYTDALEERLWEPPETATAALGWSSSPGSSPPIGSLDEVLGDQVMAEERDAFYQTIALPNPDGSTSWR